MCALSRSRSGRERHAYWHSGAWLDSDDEDLVLPPLARGIGGSDDGGEAGSGLFLGASADAAAAAAAAEAKSAEGTSGKGALLAVRGATEAERARFLEAHDGDESQARNPTPHAWHASRDSCNASVGAAVSTGRQQNMLAPALLRFPRSALPLCLAFDPLFSRPLSRFKSI